MDKDDENKRGMVIMDIDGVINSFSNRRFYLSFVYKSIKNLAKIRGRRALMQQLPKLRKSGGPNALFALSEIIAAMKRHLINITKNWLMI